MRIELKKGESITVQSGKKQYIIERCQDGAPLAHIQAGHWAKDEWALILLTDKPNKYSVTPDAYDPGEE